MGRPERGSVSELVGSVSALIINLTTCAVDRLVGQDSGATVQAKAALPALMEHKAGATEAEAEAVMSHAGFIKSRASGFKNTGGLATMMLAAKARGMSKRETPLPRPEVLRMAMAVAASQPEIRAQSLRLARWVRTAFLLEGTHFTPQLNAPGLLWALIAVELSVPIWAEVTRAGSLRSFAGNEAALLLGENTADLPFDAQLVFCELAKIAAASGSSGEDVPIVAFPLATAPRYDPNGSVPADLIPPDFDPYF